MMHKPLIVALPLLLASTAGMADSFGLPHQLSSLSTASDVPAAITPPAPHRSPAARQVTDARAPLPLASPARIPNMKCSLSCEDRDDTSAAAPLPGRTKADMHRVAERSETGTSETGTVAFARPCGPSPLSATEIETLVERIATAQGVDPQLAKAVAWAESRFDRVRNSPQGARGPMQLMPATALQLGVTDICDPHAKIDGGVRHLKQLLMQFGNPLLAVAAYNAGSRAVIDNNGIPPFAETLGFVARVVSRQIGPFPVPRHAALAPETFPSPPPMDEQGHVLGAVSHRFIDGVMHLPGQGGLR